MALVSIVTPAYNAEKYIAETIESVLHQSYENWEWIIVVDGATDNTEGVIQQYISDPRIRYITKPNTGVSDTRNQGIKLSKGDYVAFLDADDTWEKDNLALKISLLEEKKDFDWVFSDVLLADEKMEVYGVSDIGSDSNILDDLLLCRDGVVPGACSNVIVSRRCIDAGILFDTNLSTAADQDFCIQLAAKGFKGKHLKKPLWKYRVLGSSMSRNVSVMESDFLYMFDKVKANNTFKSWSFKRNCFSNLYLILAANWWNNGKHKINGLKYLIKALITFPTNITKVFSKLT